MSRKRPTAGTARRWLRCAAPVALLVLAGCAKAPVADDAGQAIEAAPGIWLGPGMGAIAGRVVSDAGLPLANARISILGTDHFGRTDSSGTFLFVNVTAGTVQVQLSATNFQSQTLDVALPAQEISRLNVTLLPDASVGAGYLPHEHDLWRGQPTYEMLDQDFALASGSDSGALPDEYYIVINGYYRGIINASMWDLPLAVAPEGNRAIVAPGTKSMDVTLSWDDATLDVLGLCHRAPKGKEICHGPKGSGGTWTIPVAPEEADGGHARWTLWQMKLYHPPWSQTLTPGTTAADIHVGITLTRGNVPVDPPHPEFWADGDSVIVHDDEFLDTTTCCSDHSSVRLESLVPPGTRRVVLEHVWEFRGAGAGPLDFDYQLLVRTGSMNPHLTPPSQFLEPAPIEGSAAAFRKLYELDIDDEDTDAFYQTASTWNVVFWNPAFDKDDFHGQHRDTVHRLTVTAHR